MVTTVNKERVKLWVDALRSGKLKQATGQLGRIVNHKAEYCCLGVGCEVAKKNGLKLAKVKSPSNSPGSPLSFCLYYGGSASTFPYVVTEWFGMKPDPVLDSHGLVCTRANDDLKFSFEKIADLIEKRYLKPARKKAAKKKAAQ